MELKCNEYFSIKELLSTENRKLIIPDFQRDYCWGDKTHGVKNNTDIVSGFLDTLFEEFTNATGDVFLGKIDVYESPKNHIYLTDGQQRLTTLYLIIGMLYRKVQDGEIKEKLKACLISDFEEKQDDIEPYLQYAVRESTVFFIRDLVNEYFSKENTPKVSEIQNQPWYFSEYDLDPSIISVLNALEIIDNKLNTNKELNIEDFSKFVINNIKIQYYDVKSKKHGEERFVIINTTGKSLTVSENIKPLLLGKFENKNFADQWEERESWFWKNRNKQKENISDNGVNDFLTWCFQIIDKQDDVDIIKKAKTLLKSKDNKTYIEKIQSIFEALELMIEYLKDERIQNQFKFINDNMEVKTIVDIRNLSKEKQLNIILPLLAFISKYENNKEECYQFIRRLRKNYFDQKWEDRKLNFVDWRYIIQIIEFSASEEEVLYYSTIGNKEKFKSISNVVLNEWYNEEERQKTILKEQYSDKIKEWEDHANFMGDLSFLFSFKSNADFNELSKYYANYISTVDLITNKYGEKEDDTENEKIKITNLFRLFLLFVGCNRVGHMSRVTWEAEGVLFSDLNRNHLHNEEYKQLIASENIQQHLKTYIKNKVREWDLFNLTEETFTPDKAIKAWLTLKVFNANKEKVALAFYDGNDTGVAVYTNPCQNNLIESEPFSVENFMCGFGVKAGGGGSYIHYTGEEYWFKANIIDTPFAGVNKERRDAGQLVKNKESIDEIMKEILIEV